MVRLFSQIMVQKVIEIFRIFRMVGIYILLRKLGVVVECRCFYGLEVEEEEEGDQVICLFIIEFKVVEVVRRIVGRML